MPKIKPAPSAREVFGNNVRRVRRIKELSQEAVAFEAGITRGHLSRIEHALAAASIDALEVIAKALDVPLRDLVDPNFLIELKDLK